MGGVIDTTLFGLIHDYFKIHLPKRRNCSPHTIRAYKHTFEAFLDFVKMQKGIGLSAVTFEMLDGEILVKFLDSLEEAGCTISTRNHRLNCIRAFYSYAAKADPTTIIHKSRIFVVPLKKTNTSSSIKYMNEKATAAILAQPDPLSKKGLRDRFIMLLMYDAAVRLSELVDIKLRDIRVSKTPVLIVQHGKGDKARDIPLMKQTVEHYMNYCKVFHYDEGNYSECPLFYTVRGSIKDSIESSTVRKLITAYGKAAREQCRDVPEHVTPHMIRHSRAMHLYQRGMDLTLLSQWLGHAKLETTLIYAYADTEMKRKAIESAVPKNSPLINRLNSERYTVSDEDTIKKLYGLK